MAVLAEKNSEIVGKLDPKYWVQKSDPLVLMRSVPFSLGELKILDTYISRINAADDERRTVVFTKDEYEQLMEIHCANYRALKKHTEGMLGKVVTLEMPNKQYLQFVLFTKAYYHTDDFGKPVIELTCTQEARDLFFCIGKYHYFKYALENVINLTRKASYLLYLYVLHNRYRGSWEISLDELRDIVLSCKGQASYLAFKEFRRAVLDPAVIEVNSKTDCRFDIIPVKRGRKVYKIKFVYCSDSVLDGQLTLDSVTAPALDPDDQYEKNLPVYGSDRLCILASSCNFEFDKPQMEQIFSVLLRINIPKEVHTDDITWGRAAYLKEKYSALNVAASRKASRKDKPITDRFKYFLAMLEDDTFQPASY